MADARKIVIRTLYNHKLDYVILEQLTFEKYMDECKFP